VRERFDIFSQLLSNKLIFTAFLLHYEEKAKSFSLFANLKKINFFYHLRLCENLFYQLNLYLKLNTEKIDVTAHFI